MAYLIKPKKGYSGPSHIVATKAKARSMIRSIQQQAAPYGGVKYSISRTSLSERDVNRNPARGIRVQVRRLPSGKVQIKIPLKRNPKSRIHVEAYVPAYGGVRSFGTLYDDVEKIISGLKKAGMRVVKREILDSKGTTVLGVAKGGRRRGRK